MASPPVCSASYSDLRPPEAGEISLALTKVRVRCPPAIGRELGDVAADWSVMVVFILQTRQIVLQNETHYFALISCRHCVLRTENPPLKKELLLFPGELRSTDDQSSSS